MQYKIPGELWCGLSLSVDSHCDKIQDSIIYLAKWHKNKIKLKIAMFGNVHQIYYTLFYKNKLYKNISLRFAQILKKETC